jgi:hypothetical protein
MAKDKAAKSRGGVNPFQKLETPAEIMSAARTGAVVSGYLAISYGLQAASLYLSGSDLFGNSGVAVLASDAIAIAFAVWLTVCILWRQPLWAAIITAIWYFVELAGKFAAPGTGQSFAAGGFGWVIMFAALASGAILGIRGAWKLRRDLGVAEVFE